MNILRWALIILSIPLIIVFILHIVARAKALSRRIDEYHAEQEAAANQPGPANPYADMASLFGADGDDKGDKRN